MSGDFSSFLLGVGFGILAGWASAIVIDHTLGFFFGGRREKQLRRRISELEERIRKKDELIRKAVKSVKQTENSQ